MHLFPLNECVLVVHHEIEDSITESSELSPLQPWLSIQHHFPASPSHLPSTGVCLCGYQNSWPQSDVCPVTRNSLRTMTKKSFLTPRVLCVPFYPRALIQAISSVWNNVLFPAGHLGHSFPSFRVQLEHLLLCKELPDYYPTPHPQIGQIPLLHSCRTLFIS